MSQASLEALVNTPEILSIRQIINEDPNIIFIQDQLKNISAEVGKNIISLYEAGPQGLPALDLSESSVKEANLWLRNLQSQKDRIVFYQIRLEEYGGIIANHWSKSSNLCMINPMIEGLRSNDQRQAYIEQVFENLVDVMQSLKLLKKKIQILEDNLETGFRNLQQQQRNLQLVAQASRYYGNPS